MDDLRGITKPVVYSVLCGFLALTLHVPAARAGMVGTAAVMSATPMQDARGRIQDLLDRADVRRALRARGVSAREVRARVDGLTNAQAQRLAARIDQLPAGGGDFFVDDAVGLAVLVFLVLLFTDILGLTDVFPFVKHHVRR